MSDKNNEYLRRHNDYADLPRPLVWALVSIKEVGINAVVIGALLYICFVSLSRVTTSLESNTIKMVEVISANTNALNLLKREIKRSAND